MNSAFSERTSSKSLDRADQQAIRLRFQYIGYALSTGYAVSWIALVLIDDLDRNRRLLI